MDTCRLPTLAEQFADQPVTSAHSLTDEVIKDVAEVIQQVEHIPFRVMWTLTHCPPNPYLSPIAITLFVGWIIF